MIKNEMFNITNGLVTPIKGTNTVSVVDYNTPVTIIIETNKLENSMLLVRENFMADGGWEPVTDNLGSTGNVILNEKRKDVTINVPGVYGLTGKVVGFLRAYSIRD